MLKLILVCVLVFLLVGTCIAAVYHSDKKKLLQVFGLSVIVGAMTVAVLSFVVIVF